MNNDEVLILVARKTTLKITSLAKLKLFLSQVKE